ncbi:MAG: mechanosensitive ion channel [Gammaproteobacteria bacterium]|nr:mechanosensitive ion channel [Gammaproteobacteria bacterium]
MNETLGARLFSIGDTAVTSWGLLRVVLLLLGAVLLSRFLRGLLRRVGERQQGRQGTALYTVSRLLHYVLVISALLIGLASIGLDFSQLALVAGALSIGIGFGLQSLVNNFVSGLMILVERNLRVGDLVELGSGVRGRVREINVRSTLITTGDAIDIVVPNAEFISGRVVNYTLKEPYYRVHVPFGVAWGADKETVRRVVTEAADRLPFTWRGPGRDTDVWLVGLADTSMNFELVAWIDPAAAAGTGSVTGTYLWEIESALTQHGIAIAPPQRDIRVQLTPP